MYLGMFVFLFLFVLEYINIYEENIEKKNLDKSQTKIFLVSWKVQSLLCKTIFLDKVYILILLPTQGQATE